MTHKGKPEVIYIAISRADGGLSVMEHTILLKRNPEDPGLVIDPTPENIQATIDKVPRYAGSTWRIMEPSEIPADRTYRNAWKDEGRKIALDPVKAAAIDEKRKLDDAVAKALKSQHEALVESVKASMK